MSNNDEMKSGSMTLETAVVYVEPPPFSLRFNDAIVGQLGHRKVLVIDDGQPSRCVPDGYDQVISGDLYSFAGIERVLERISTTYRAVAVIGLGETAVIATAFLAEHLEVKGIGFDVAIRCRDKFRMIETLDNAGVPVPRYFVTDAADDPATQVHTIGGFPVVCKPRMGFAGAGVIRADDLTALQSALRRIRRLNKFAMNRYYQMLAPGSNASVLIESFQPGLEVAVDGYVEHGKMRVLSIIDKPGVSVGPYFDDAIHITPTKLPNPTVDLITDVVHSCVEAIGLTDSPFHVEAKLSGTDVVIIEIGARIGFPRCLYMSTGIDIAEIALDLSMGQPVKCERQWQRYAGNCCIYAEKLGYFKSITNRDAVLAEPGITDVVALTTEGMRVAPPPEGHNYICFILSESDSYSEVEAALRRARGQLEVDIK